MINFFKKKDEKVVAPVSGKCISIDQVNDEVFSSKAMGDGFAIIPNDHVIVSPVDGEIVLIANTKHAFGLKTKAGIEILVHIGLDTVALEGKGFTVHAKQGMKVKAGEPIIEFDQSYMKEQSIDMTTMIIFTSGINQSIELDCYGKQVNQGEILISNLMN